RTALHRHPRFVFRPAPTPDTYPFPSTTLFRSEAGALGRRPAEERIRQAGIEQLAIDLSFGRPAPGGVEGRAEVPARPGVEQPVRSEEHTSELQSRENLVCRLLLEKKKKQKPIT